MTTTPAPAAPPILRYFSYDHLPTGYPRAISATCHALAFTMVKFLPGGPELSAGLRHLLEAKDCFVRASLDVAGVPAPAELDATNRVLAVGAGTAEKPEAEVEGEGEVDWLAGSTCNPDEPESCDSCQ